MLKNMNEAESSEHPHNWWEIVSKRSCGNTYFTISRRRSFARKLPNNASVQFKTPTDHIYPSPEVGELLLLLQVIHLLVAISDTDELAGAPFFRWRCGEKKTYCCCRTIDHGILSCSLPSYYFVSEYNYNTDFLSAMFRKI